MSKLITEKSKSWPPGTVLEIHRTGGSGNKNCLKIGNRCRVNRALTGDTSLISITWLSDNSRDLLLADRFHKVSIEDLFDKDGVE